MTKADIILEVDQLEIAFQTHSGVIRAVQGASFQVERGKILGVVGESGCGKSVTAQAIMNMVPRPGAITGGRIRYRPRETSGQSAAVVDIAALDPYSKDMRAIRGNEIAMIFQEPMTSLDPLYTIGNQLMEAITEHQHLSSRDARQRAIETLSRVKLPEPQRLIDSYPHELSGGMRQRVMIAIGLSCNPRLLIADEPTTALDVTTQAEILELMRELQEDTGMSIIFITHDLGVIAEMCDEVAVMYLGKVVEKTDVDSAFYDPKHPYTRALLKSIPKIEHRVQPRLEAIRGTVPSPSNLPAGCAFHPRCPEFMPGVCDAIVPPLIQVSEVQEVRCLLYGGQDQLNNRPQQEPNEGEIV